MGWLLAIKLVLRLADGMLRYAGDRQLMDAGEAEAARDQLADNLDAIDRAIDARRGVDHDPDRVRDDPRNRDRD